MPAKSLKPISPQPGRPLYLTARDAVREAIDNGVFSPGEQMPSTKELSEQLCISLVTAHRALQELVSNGVLSRSQGRGTFVHERYHERKRTLSNTRLGLIFHAESSLADYYHGQILEGVRQAAHHLAVDLVMLRYGEDIRGECNGYLFVNPRGDEAAELAVVAKPRQPIMAVGARVKNKRVSCIDVDNVDLARQAVAHLSSLGHTQIAFVGGADDLSNSVDRWNGFLEACSERGIKPKEAHIIKGVSWRLDEKERLALIRVLSGPNRPTAVFAAGYYFALDVYGAASTVGLRIPEDFSLVGVDDPPSAAHLSPPMTTLRQPLVQLGHAGVTTLFEQIQSNRNEPVQRTLWAELVIRRSSGPVR
ncbi:MAG: GntR family transcriptional regulator [Phycisphaerae bacterium]|nr:GntR family transcriptional regulator [Phycisphaerae bacterium]